VVSRLRVSLFCLFALGACRPASKQPSADVPPVVLGEPPAGCAEPEIRGVVTSTECDELSGLAASRRHPGILWAVNDSGEATLRVFALDSRGTLQATYSLAGLTPFDVEDLAVWHRPDRDRDVVLLADIGDNLAREGGAGRAAVTLYAVPEPDPQQPALPASVEFTLRLVYPDRPHDAEGLFVDPVSGALYVFAKETFGPSNVYRLAPPFSGGTRTLDLVGTLPVGTVRFPGLMITAASIRHDGGMIAFRTYGSLLAFHRAAGTSVEAALKGPVHVLPLPHERQGESLTFAAGGLGLYSVSEGAQPRLHHTSLACVEAPSP